MSDYLPCVQSTEISAVETARGAEEPEDQRSGGVDGMRDRAGREDMKRNISESDTKGARTCVLV